MTQAKTWLHIVNRMNGGVKAVIENLLYTGIEGYKQNVIELATTGSGFFGLYKKRKYAQSSISTLPSDSVVHIHCGLRSWLYCSSRKDIRQIVTIHGIVPPHGIRRLWEKLDLMLLSRARASLVAVSDTCRRKMNRINPLHRPVTVIPNGTLAPAFSLRLQDNSSETVNVIFVGALWENKGIHTFLSAAQLLNDAPIIFTVFGEGPESAAVEKACASNKNIRWVRGMYKASKIFIEKDILVFPSRFEGCPMVILEAMSYGVTCIASDIPSIREIIDDGRDGILIKSWNPEDYASAINMLAKSKERREKIAASAREKWVTSYTSQLMAQRYLELANTGLV
ncbi:MAG: glycosyltransferase family 4 protein [Deltaproteobacteria bacterium]|nr:glycosyltransferase family 4 protein [Deltaproteobacteria bacterium]